MYIRKTTKISKGKTYTHYLLVESVHTPKGPRQRTICSLGSLGPGPLEQWHALARKGEASLAGQLSLEPTALPMEPMVDKAPQAPSTPDRSRVRGRPSTQSRSPWKKPARLGRCTLGLRCGTSWGWRRFCAGRGCRRGHAC